MAKKIQVVVVRPGEPPKIEELEQSLAGYQEVVGGYIQRVVLAELPHCTVDIWCNDEGLINGSKLNRLVNDDLPIYGTFFIAKTVFTPEENRTEGLTNEQAYAMLNLAATWPYALYGVDEA